MWPLTLWSNDLFLPFCPPWQWLKDTISHAIRQFAFLPGADTHRFTHLQQMWLIFFFFFFFWEGGIHLFFPQKDRIAGNNTQFPNKTWNSATCSLNFDPVFFPPQSKHSNLNYLASTRYMSFSLSIKLSQVNSNLWINVTSFLIKIVQHYIMLYKSLILN